VLVEPARSFGDAFRDRELEIPIAHVHCIHHGNGDARRLLKLSRQLRDQEQVTRDLPQGSDGGPAVLLLSSTDRAICWHCLVIRLGAESKPSEDRFKGWVEEVDSGKELRFHSTGELIQFLGERFRAALQSCHKQVDQRDFGACEGEES